MAEPKTYLAVDIGAESGRVIAGTLLHGKLDLNELHKFPNGPSKGGDGHLHWEIQRLFQEIKTGLRKAADEYGDSLVSVGIDTWGVDYGLLDAGGKLLNTPFHYRDSRTKGMMGKVFSLIPREAIYQRTGLQFMEFNTLFQLMAENRQHLNQAERLLFTPDLLSFWLTGKAVTEETIASTSQLLNASTRNWDADILASLDISPSLFAPLTPPATLIGPVQPGISHETGCRHLQVIAVGGHDTASAVAAVPFEDPATSAYLSSGTWSLLGLESDRPIINDQSAQRNVTNEWGLEGTYRILKNIVGLWIIQECRRYWKDQGTEYDYETLKQMAAKAEPFYAYLDVDYPPLAQVGEMPEKIRVFLRDTNQTVPDPEDHGQIIRIATEGLALKYAAKLRSLEELKQGPIHTLHIVGGGSQHTLLNQMTANATGKTVRTGPTEGTAAGNILAQLLADGTIPSLQEGRKIIAHTFELSTYHPEDVESWKSARLQLEQLCAPR